MAQGYLPVGKLDPSLLKELIYTSLGYRDPRVLIGPGIGEDAAIIDFDGKVLVVHSDPITGAIENIGWLAVNICTNDIAVRGVKPLWISIVMLLPEKVTSQQVRHIASQVDEAAKELRVAIIGGHSEVTSSLNRPIMVATAIGEAYKGRFVASSGARVGDRIILTKGAAIEGTAILSTELAGVLERKVGRDVLRRGQGFIRMISVLKDSLTAMEVGGVHAMHDATEGGVAGGLQEIAWASGVGIVAYEDKIKVHEETRVICEALNIDPLRTISSGSLIISAKPEKAEEMVESLSFKGVQASIIGKAVERGEGLYILRRNGALMDLSNPVQEQLWIALKKVLQEA